MHQRAILLIAAIILSSNHSAHSQGMMEFKGINALSAGAGAGAAAAMGQAASALSKMNGGKAIGSIVTASQADIVRYKNSGQQFEKQKDWAKAAQCYQFCISNLRRGN